MLMQIILSFANVTKRTLIRSVDTLSDHERKIKNIKMLPSLLTQFLMIISDI